MKHPIPNALAIGTTVSNTTNSFDPEVGAIGLSKLLKSFMASPILDRRERNRLKKLVSKSACSNTGPDHHRACGPTGYTRKRLKGSGFKTTDGYGRCTAIYLCASGQEHHSVHDRKIDGMRDAVEGINERIYALCVWIMKERSTQFLGRFWRCRFLRPTTTCIPAAAAIAAVYRDIESAPSNIIYIGKSIRSGLRSAEMLNSSGGRNEM